MGTVRLEFLETPGHTPEGVSVVIFDGTHPEPFGVLTGDTLFVGDVGRPDLLASIGYTSEQLGRMLYHSLHDKLLRLPDATRVFPAHGAGSMCGKALGTERSTTIGEQKQLNYALQPMSEDAFLKLVTEDQPTAPRYFVHDAVLNRQGRPTLAELLQHAKPMSPAEARREMALGAVLLDTRDADPFAARHVRGSLNIDLDGKFATWAGSVLDADARIVVLAEPGREKESLVRLGRVGLDRVAGYVEGGIEAFPPDAVERAERVTADELQVLRETNAVQVLDVREASERATGAIPGSLHVSLKELPDRLAELPRETELVVHCAGGYRSSAAASFLRARGWRARDLAGGYAAWAETQGGEAARP